MVSNARYPLLAVTLASLLVSLACNSEDGRFAVGSGASAGTDAIGGGGAAGGSAGSSGTAGGGNNSVAAFEVEWARRFTAPDDQRASALSARSDGVVVAANLQGTLTVDNVTVTSAGSDDVLLLSLLDDGNPSWGIASGDANLQEVFGLAASRQTEQLAMTGSHSGSLFNLNANQSEQWTAKFDPAGALLWSNALPSNKGLGITFDNLGKTVTVGNFSGMLDITFQVDSAGKLDAFMLWNNDSSGRHAGFALGSAEDDAFSSVAANESGAVFATGWLGAAPTTKVLDPTGGGNDVVVVGFESQPASGQATPTFIRAFGDANDQFGRAIAVIPATDEFVVVGDFEGSIDFGTGPLQSSGDTDIFVARFDETGQALSAFAIGGPLDQFAKGVAVDSTGRVVVVGDFEGSLQVGAASFESAGKSDVFVARFTDDTLESFEHYGDAENQTAVDVAIGEGDSVYVLANVQGAIAFGERQFPAEDNSFDFVVARLAP
jgi:hypothetical protein